MKTTLTQVLKAEVSMIDCLGSSNVGGCTTGIATVSYHNAARVSHDLAAHGDHIYNQGTRYIISQGKLAL